MNFSDIDTISSQYKHIYLSPHFDDAIFSCGGNMGLQTLNDQASLIITIFASVPSFKMKFYSFAFKVHRGMGFNILNSHYAQNIVNLRRREDVHAATYLQADSLWLDNLDAIYRGTPSYYTQLEHLLGGAIHPKDIWIEKQLTQDLLTMHKRMPNAIWYAPLGVGLHVDHQIVSLAAQRLMTYGAHVEFYEDFPYVAGAGVLQKILPKLNTTLQPTIVEVAQTLRLRQAAAEFYTSQIRMSFGSKTAMSALLTNYAYSIYPEKRVPVERYWHFKSDEHSDSPRLLV